MTYTQTARPGSRAPHAWLSPGRSTLDLFGRSFVLLRFDAAVDVTVLVRRLVLHGVNLPLDTALVVVKTLLVTS